MKKSKKTVALIAAVLMTVTMFSSAIPAYAAKKSDTKTISCGGQGAICSIESENKYTASAITTSILKYDYFKNISSAHIVKKGTSENGTSLELHW